MSLARRLLDSFTLTIGYLKRNRRAGVPVVEGQPIKINLGCGLAVCKGWINIDGSPNALIATWPKALHRLCYRLTGANRYYSESEYCRLLGDHHFMHHDLAYGIPLHDQSVDYVYSSHFLEHLYKGDAERLIRESYRVLRHGGILRICVPDLEYALSLYARGEKEKMLLSYFFVEDKESHYARHKYMYDFSMLKALLEQIGFTNVVRCVYRQGGTPDLDILDNRPEETLFVEADRLH